MASSTSIVIPTYNEEAALGQVLDEIAREASGCEVIVVDDGSTDGTASIALAHGARLIKHPKNMGYTAAMMTGIKAATGEIIVTMNADYTYPAAYVPKLVELINSGCEMAIGRRVANSGNMPRLNRLGNQVFSDLISLLAGASVSDVQSGLRAFRKGLLDELGVRGRNFEFETEITAKAVLIGCKVVEIPIEYRPRVGKSKLHPVRDGYAMLRATFRFISEAFSPAIKIFFIYPGLISMVIAVLLTITTLNYYFADQLPAHQFFPLLTVLFAIGGIQLTGIGIALNALLARTRRAGENSGTRSSLSA